ncbi:unnamed protein product [Trichogramma brassicae]|uniref:Uncharacterized protein n=1 Tax=Trichogramma brassicae TaxID=86971 RepID=A0A6H5IVV3_9HYME|nr:unnamed protein product [Trichogramma brassicae]
MKYARTCARAPVIIRARRHPHSNGLKKLQLPICMVFSTFSKSSTEREPYVRSRLYTKVNSRFQQHVELDALSRAGRNVLQEETRIQKRRIRTNRYRMVAENSRLTMLRRYTLVYIQVARRGRQCIVLCIARVDAGQNLHCGGVNYVPKPSRARTRERHGYAGSRELVGVIRNKRPICAAQTPTPKALYIIPADATEASSCGHVRALDFFMKRVHCECVEPQHYLRENLLLTQSRRESSTRDAYYCDRKWLILAQCPSTRTQTLSVIGVNILVNVRASAPRSCPSLMHDLLLMPYSPARQAPAIEVGGDYSPQQHPLYIRSISSMRTITASKYTISGYIYRNIGAEQTNIEISSTNDKSSSSQCRPLTAAAAASASVSTVVKTPQYPRVRVNKRTYERAHPNSTRFERGSVPVKFVQSTAKMSKIILLLALLVAVAAATPQQYPPNIIDFWRQQVLEEATEKPVEKTCSPWKGPVSIQFMRIDFLFFTQSRIDTL